MVAVVAISFFEFEKTPARAVVASGHPEWSPIMFKDGEEIKGAGPALVKMIFDDLGLNVTFPYKGAWDEVQAKARSGEVDVLVAAYKTDERQTYMDYSNAYTTDPVALFVRSDDQFEFTKWEDLIGKKGVGTVGDSYGQQFDDFIKEKLNFSIAQTSSEAFDMVIDKKADYFVYSLFAGEREIANRDLKDKIAIQPKYVVEENFYVTFSKQSPFASYQDEVNKLIEKYKSDGTIDRLIAEYKTK